MKLLVTGATGFIGGHLVQRLITDGHAVSALVRSDSNTDTIPKEVSLLNIPEKADAFISLFSDKQFDGVIHLATHFTPSHTADQIECMIDANITFGTHIVEAATSTNVPWLINTGTFSQYDAEGAYAPANLYAATKQAFQDMLTYYAQGASTKIITLMLFNTFGPGDTRKKIFTLWKEALDSNTPLPMSPGEQIIDTSYIDNIVEGFCHAAHLLHEQSSLLTGGETYSLPSSERTTLRDLATLYADVIGKKLPIQFGAMPYRPHEIMVPLVGKPLPGWEQRISVREGLTRTYLS